MVTRLALVVLAAALAGCASKAKAPMPSAGYYEMPKPYTRHHARAAYLIPECDPPSETLEDECDAAAEILASDPRTATERYLVDWRDAAEDVRYNDPASDPASAPLDLRGASADDALFLVPFAVVLALGDAGSSAPAGSVRARRIERVRSIQGVALRALYESKPDDPYCQAMLARLDALKNVPANRAGYDLEAAHREASARSREPAEPAP